VVGLPLLALRLFFTRPKLLALGLFPGLFTLAAALAATYSTWAYSLQYHSPWVAWPLAMLVFLASWLLVGNLSLLPVEDPIADECQRAVWGEVRIPAAHFGLKRLFREMLYSLGLVFGVAVLFFLSLIPAFNFLGFLLAAWVTAYGFLSALLNRRATSVRGRLNLFFRHAAGNFLLGFFINCLLFVPLLNVFLLGYAQILATLVFLRREPNTSRK
jgi:uncharacterized protein involved in cysteine biosynthesis